MIANSFDLKKDVLLRELRGRILGGHYVHGEKLPVEVHLAEELSVSRDTLRAALKQLEMEGLLVRIRSKGTFVNFPSGSNRNKILVLLKPAAENDASYQSHYLMPSMQQAAQEYGMSLELCPRTYIDDQNLEDAVAKLRYDRELAGCVIFEGLYSGKENYIRALQRSNLPVVMAVCHPGDVQTTGFAGVRVDSLKAWHDGILALKEAGHRRIAFFHPGWVQGYYHNLDRFYSFLREIGLYYPELICNSPIQYANIRNELKRAMSLGNPPTAAMCTSDFLAICVIKAANDLKIRIPEQLSIMGYCGAPGGKFLTPPLSTVDFHYDAIGKKVIEVIVRSDLWFGKQNTPPPEIIMPHDVVMRESALCQRVEPLFS